MKIILLKSLSYYRAGILLHLISLLFAAITVFLVKRIFQTEVSSLLSQLALLLSTVFFFTNSILAELDARSRYQNYKQVKDQLFTNGYSERILKPMLKSMCQRDAAMLAAKELGIGAECSLYFREQGYRWYHILPDFVFREPQFLMSKYFWRTTFFTPVYHPRFDFYSDGKEARLNVE